MNHDLLVIGAGPGGYIAAIRAAQLGLNVGCVEKEPALGGTCLRVGCIPSKALLESSHLLAEAREKFATHGIQTGGVTLDLATMLGRKDQIVSTLTKGIDGLFKKNKITRYLGQGASWLRRRGHFRSNWADRSHGPQPAHCHRQQVGEFAGHRTRRPVCRHQHRSLVVSRSAGSSDCDRRRLHRPGTGERLVRLGARVTVLEFLDRIMPGTDSEVAGEALKLFKKQGLEFRLGAA